MRRSSLVAVVVAGMLVGQLAPVTLAAGSEDEQLPPGTILLIGEIVAAQDAANHNFLTGPKTEAFPDVEYVDLVYEILENEFELLLFPDGLVVGEGDVIRNIETRTRYGREAQLVEYHAHFHSSVEVGIEANWDGEDPGRVTGTFEMRSGVLDVFVNEVSVGTPSEIPPGPLVPGTFEATWSPSTGELKGILTPADPMAHPGVLTLEAFSVGVEGGGLMSSGPHGLNLTAIQQALVDCGDVYLPQPSNWDEDEWIHEETKICQSYRSEQNWESLGPTEVAEEIVQFAIDMGRATNTSGARIYPSIGVTGVLEVIGSLAQMVVNNPDDPQALRALVGFLNFNLLIRGCTDQECPA